MLMPRGGERRIVQLFRQPGIQIARYVLATHGSRPQVTGHQLLGLPIKASQTSPHSPESDDHDAIQQDGDGEPQQ
jgi:hypothetical protein